MKSTPILFSGEMVRAILEGRKTQTRRVLKTQPTKVSDLETPRKQKRGDLFLAPDLMPTSDQRNWVFAYAEDHATTRCLGAQNFCELFSPYGMPGDELWVKETHWLFGRWYRDGLTKTGRPRWRFRADKLHRHASFTPPHVKPKRTSKGWHKRPSIFMPRWASRIALEITDTTVEQLHDISEKDCLRESVPYTPTVTSSYKNQFAELWDSINGKKHPWKKNEWVFAITFKRKL